MSIQDHTGWCFRGVSSQVFVGFTRPTKQPTKQPSKQPSKQPTLPQEPSPCKPAMGETTSQP